MAHAVLKVVGLSGSLRKQSFNTRLLAAMAAAAAPGVRLHVNDDLRHLPLFDEDLEDTQAGLPASVEAMRKAVAQADAVVIATPEYLNSIPGGLKNAIDWLARGEQSALAGKPVAIIGATSGTGGTRLSQAALRQVLLSAGALAMPAPPCYLNNAPGLFAPDGMLADARTAQTLAGTLLALRDWHARVGRPR